MICFNDFDSDWSLMVIVGCHRNVCGMGRTLWNELVGALFKPLLERIVLFEESKDEDCDCCELSPINNC